MASDKLTPAEVSWLLLLMAEAREVGNAELKDRYGDALTGASRRKLADLKLIESRKGARGAYFHQLSELGWAKCNDGFDIQAGGSRVTGHALGAVMTGLRRFLDQKGLRMVHVYAMDSVAGQEPEPEPELQPQSQPEPLPASVAEAQAIALPRDLVTEIRQTYRALADAPGDWVSLADLRPLLGEVEKSAVDEALITMIEQARDVNLVPESNQKELTDAVRKAAVWVGGQHKHLISIGAA